MRLQCVKCGYIADEDEFDWDESYNSKTGNEHVWRTCPKCEATAHEYEETE